MTNHLEQTSTAIDYDHPLAICLHAQRGITPNQVAGHADTA
jgi:hypothetical protein